MSQTNTLELPDVETIALAGLSTLYGAGAVAAAYCGFRDFPGKPRGSWKHGWTPAYWPFEPTLLIAGEDISKEKGHPYWVARIDEEIKMHRSGYRNCRAIGLPIVYLPPPRVQRKPGSLLVMPVHSAADTSHQWKCAEYADQIDRIRTQFSEVLICVHPSCWKNGFWVGPFKERGFAVVSGAQHNDRNALTRIATLLSSFEYVTTNGFGSLLAYGAYLGAKVSIFGSYAEYTVEGFSKDPFYRDNPHLLEPVLDAVAEQAVRRQYADLFCHPLKATQRAEWGRHEVGADNKVTPAQLRSLFGWNLSHRLARRVRAAVASRLPTTLKNAVKMVLCRG